MKNEYISRQVALDALGVTKNATKYGGDHSGYDTRMLYEIHDALTGIPAADVVPVVRCKDCKHFELNPVTVIDDIPLILAHEICTFWGNGCKTAQDGFCSLGERREE